MEKNREADKIYDTRTVYGNFKWKKLHVDNDTSVLRALRVKILVVGQVFMYNMVDLDIYIAFVCVNVLHGVDVMDVFNCIAYWVNGSV